MISGTAGPGFSWRFTCIKSWQTVMLGRYCFSTSSLRQPGAPSLRFLLIPADPFLHPSPCLILKQGYDLCAIITQVSRSGLIREKDGLIEAVHKLASVPEDDAGLHPSKPLSLRPPAPSKYEGRFLLHGAPVHERQLAVVRIIWFASIFMPSPQRTCRTFPS